MKRLDYERLMMHCQEALALAEAREPKSPTILALIDALADAIAELAELTE